MTTMAYSRIHDEGFGLAIQRDAGSPRLSVPSQARAGNLGASPSITETSNPDQLFVAGRESEPLTWGSPNAGVSSAMRCRSRKEIRERRLSAGSIFILVLAVYTVILSGIWLGLAIARPHFNQFIRSGGSIDPSAAPTIFTAFAKSIELSFVTVFISFLGQFLSRKSLSTTSDISIADMDLRTFISI